MTEDLPEPQLRPVEPRPRRPQTLGGALYLFVAGATAAGLAIAALGTWRTGLTWMGAAVGFAALGRLLLPDDRAGMLKVRRKSLDVLVLTVLSAGLITLALAVPDAAAPP